MSRRVRCKFFAHGACLKGEHCEFLHDWEDPPNNICTYYQKGICSYGSRCRYQHVRPSCSNTGASSSSAIARRSSASHLGRVTQPARNEDNRVTSILGVPPEARNENNRATPILGVPPELSSPSTPFFPSGKPARNAVSGKLKLLENAEGIRPPRHGRPADRPLCSFVVTGVCPHGDKCPHIHGDLCPTCGKHCLHPFRPHQREEHLKLCEKKQKHLEALKRSQEVECSVCLDHVLSKATAAERKFGLLSECDHPFCISCIRNWRSSSPSSGVDVNTALRACPICRKVSYFVIPSVIWYSSKEEKQEIVDNYKLKLSSIDCKHFNLGNGNCPFGTSCFYKHTVKPGSYMWRYHRPPPRRRATRRSNVVDMDTFYDMFEHLIGEDAPDIFDAEDFFDEDLTPMDMALLLMQMNVGSSDDSSEEDNYLF